MNFSVPEVPSDTVALARGFSWLAYRFPGERFVGDTAFFRTPQVAGANLFPAVFENGQFVVETSGNLIDGGLGGDAIGGNANAVNDEFFLEAA